MRGKATIPGSISWASSITVLCLLVSTPVFGQARPEDRLDATLKLLYRARHAAPGLPAGVTPERSREIVDRLLGVPLDRRLTQRAAGGAEPALTLLVRYTGDESRLRGAGFEVQARLGSVYTGTLAADGLPELLRLPEVRFVQASRRLRANGVSGREGWGGGRGGERGIALRPLPNNMTGAGAVVAYIDTGVDVFHQDFRLPGGATRIKFLLDLSDPGDVNDDGVLDGLGPYGGTLYTEADINAALGAGTIDEKDTTGHGTHGLSIAAGDDPVLPGLAPAADLVVVKATREDGSLGFWSADLVNALAFVDEKALELGRPYVANLSLGTLLSSHDGRSLEEQAIDALVGPGVPGKAVVVAAGNSSDNRGSHFRHLSGRTFVGLETSHALSVPAYTPNPDRGNDRVLLDLWYEGRDKQSLIVRAPVSRPDCPEIVAPFGDIADFSTPCGDVFVANLGGPNPSNGDIEALVLIDDWSGTPPAVGEWTIAVRGEEIGEAGTYHGWLGEDSQVGSVPPYLSGNADNRFLVGKPGGAYHAITVGAYADHDAATRYRTSWIDVNGGSRVDTTAVVGDISDFSSPGPTRDGRTKPELAAPGERTLGAVSRDAYPTTAPHSIYRFHPFPDPEALIVDRSANHAFGALQGTSFSAPVVTGLAARVLSENPALDAIQVRNVLVNAAVADGFTGTVPNEVWGYGKVDEAVGGSPLPSDLRITVDSLPGGAVGEPYNIVLTASGGSLPYAWTVSAGSLPPGLALESRGFLTGVPTSGGTFDVTLQVTDVSAPAQTDSREYRIAIAAVPPLAIVTVSVPSARIEKPYEAVLEAEGGTPPYVWSFAGGSLPGGLYFFANGLIQGSPDMLGRFNFTARVQDALGAVDLRSFRLRVLSPGGEDWDPLGKTTPTVNAIAVDPNDPSRVFVSTRNIDAVFETTNAGDSWRATSINNNLNTFASRLAISPVDSVPWALAGSPQWGLAPHFFDRALERWMPRPGGGTYAIDFDASDTVFTLSGPTLMRSDDLGLTWQALANTCGGWSTGVSVHRPNARYMYALGASPDLTCLTEDGGVTWPDVTNLSGGGVDIRVSQANPFDVVKAGPGVAWKSLDGGRNWTPSALRGAMCCLDRSPTTPSVVLAGTSEGVFKSSDGGQTWRESRIRSQILAVTSVAIDPSNADNYYVGTDQGVFHSADGGITWALKNNGLIRRTLNSVVVSGAAPTDVLIVATDGPYVSRTAGDAWTLSREGLTSFNNHHPVVSPADPNLFFVANDNGVFRSDNRGVTWYPPDPSFAAGFGVVAMDADPHDPNVVVASLSGTRGTYRSTNRGQTWNPINAGLPFVEPTDLSFARDVAGRLYVAFKSKGVYRSEDRGTTWAPLGLNDITVGEVEPAPSDSGYLYARSGSVLYFRDPAGSGRFEPATESPARPVNDIAVDPNEPTVAWAGADHSGVAGETGGVYKTSDGGRTWAHLPGILDSFDVVSLATSPTISGTVYAATLNAGVYRSTDGGLTWTELANYGTVANLTNVTVQDPGNPLLLYAGTAGYGVQLSTDRGKTFVPRVKGLTNFFVNAIAFDPETPNVVYAATEAGIFRSVDSGANWSFTGQTTGEITDLVTDTEGAIKRIWGTVRGQGVAVSEDGGATFAVYSTGLASLELTSLEVEVRGAIRRIWGTTRGGDGVAYSDDLGRTWAPAAGNGLTDRNVNDLTVEQGTTRRIWGTTDSGVFFSENDGLSWTELSAGLPSGVPVTSVVVDPNTSEVLVSLFSGEEGGVYRGGNLRGAWSPFNSGLDELRVRRLTRDPGHVIDAATVGTTYYAATAGDGVYATEIQSETGGTLTVATTSLPDGLLRTSYAATLSAQGGTPPYFWSVAGGSLPPGISLDPATGALGGEPGQVGLFSFTVQASDSSSRTDRKDLAIDVLSPDVPTLSIDDVSRLEGNSGSATTVFTVSLSQPSDDTVTVGYATGDLTASAGVDYTAAAGILTFDSGVTSQTVSVSVTGDTAEEPDETFFVGLSGASGATIARSQGIGTILDDDSPPSLAIGDVTVNEGNTGTANAVFTVTLSRSVGFGVTVDFATADGTATAPADFQPASGMLTFVPGTTSQTITVAVNGDTFVEPDETFGVSLTNAVNATIADGEGQASILDEDGIPAISVADTTATEGAKNAVFSVTLSTSSVGSVEVGYATFDGTAVAGADYQATSGTLVFPAGERARTVSVPLTVADDTIDQEPRTFFLTLSGPTGATIADGQATATILDDDMRTLSIDSPRVTEGGTAVFTVSLDAPSVRTITVDFTTVPGTATADVDYQTTAGTLTFPPGALTQSIVVPVSGNPVDEPNETFKVVLSNPVNARIAPRQGPLAMTWTQLGPTPPFGPAYNHTRSVYDAGTDRLMVVQSGYSSAWVLENALANDAASRWRQLSPSGPAPVGREWAAVAFDAGSNRLILHGGTPSGRETWLLTGANGLGAAQWIRLPDYPGNPHWQMAPAYDAGTNRLIVFGGTVPDVGHTTETWVLKDANGLGNPQWVKLAPGGVAPHPRYSNSVGYDPVTNRLILFGGDNAPGSPSNPSGMDNDLWVLTNANGLGGVPAWIRLMPEGTPPGVRGYHSMAYDPPANQLYVFGGYKGHFGSLVGHVVWGDTWLLANANGAGAPPRWMPVPTTGPSPRYFSAHASGGEAALIVLQGWNATAEWQHNELWALKDVPAGTATILDDDPPPSVSVNDASVVEGNSGLRDAVFTLSLSNPSERSIEVGYGTGDGSARSGPDYVATTASLTIPAGATSATFAIPVKGDVFLESDETFVVNLTSASNATIGDGQGQGTIVNDDVPSPNAPVPALQSIDPEAKAPGSAGFELRAFGANFVPTSVVRWNGANRATTFVSARELKAAIAAADVGTAGVVRVSVFTPAPGGGSSEPLPFVVRAATGTVSFTRADLPTGTGSRPRFVTAADLNADGRSDVVTANTESDSVSVFLGNGDGTFQPRVDYAGGDYPRWVHVADLDKDGDADLAVANDSSGDVSAFLGNGDGTFAPRVDYVAGVRNVYTVAAGDFNADGLLDLAAGGEAGVSVLLRNGDGTYLSPGYVSASGYSVRMLGTGDLNGDARLDLLAGTVQGVQLLAGNGEGVFTSTQVAAWCCDDWHAAPADFNRDGALDFVYAVPGWGVSSMAGNNAGQFGGYAGFWAPSPYFPALGDFNADGTVDVAVTNLWNASVSVSLGFATATVFATGVSPYGAAAADFNGDGRLDLATANHGSDTVSILTNAPPPSLAIGDISVAEGNLGGKDATFTVTLSPSTIATVTVNYATADGTAKTGSDYVGTSGSLTFLPGETTKSVTVTIFGDTTYEASETFFLNLSGINGALLVDGQGQATIENDDPGLILSVDDVSVAEGDSASPTATFTVSMPAAVPAGQTVTVSYTTADGTATAGSDYQATSGTLTFAQGQSAKLVSVAVVPDAFDELDETFTLNLSSASGAVIGDAQGVATILDDDQATLTVNDLTVTEGSSGLTSAVFTLTLSAPSAAQVVVAYGTADGSARSGPDYVATSGSVTIPTGQTSGTLSVPVKGDVFFESDETFFVNLTSATNATIGDAQGQCTIVNDDVPSPDGPVPALQSIDPVAAAPGGSGFELRLFGANFLPSTVVRWNGTSRATTFVSARELRAAILAADTATPGTARVSVFTPAPGGGSSEPLPFVVRPPSPIVSFTRTNLSTGTGSRPYSVASADLNADGFSDIVTANNGGDTVSVLLGNGDGTFRPRVNYPGGDNPSWVHVADIDKDGDPDLAVANYFSADVSVLAGNGDGTFAPRVDHAAGVGGLYTVVAGDFNADGLLDLAAGGEAGVSVLLRNGDGTYLSPGYVSAAGQTVGMLGVGDFNGDARLDLLASGRGQEINLLIGNGEGVFSASPAGISWSPSQRAVPADLNRDGALDLAIASNGWSAVYPHLGNNVGGFTQTGGWGAPSAYFPVVADFNADGTPDVAVTALSHAGLSVLLGYGSYGLGLSTLFAVGESPYGAAAADFDGDGRMDLVTANYGSDTISVLTNAPPPSLMIGDISVSEGNLGGKDATFTVTLSPVTIATVTVNYATADGSAKAGSDYVAKSGSLTFLPGETTKTVTVTVFGDTAYEPDETFFLDLSGVNGAILADAQGRATVVNDDAGFLLSVNDVTVTEGNAGSPQAAFTVSMPVAVPVGQTVTVNYTTADGTAAAGSDYQATSGTLTFSAGQSSRTIAVPLVPDLLDEPDETFTMNLSNASGAVIVDAQGVATIVDDDDVTLTVGDVTVTEGNAGLGNATFTASLSAPSGRPIDLDYATADDTARAGPDYVTTSGRVSFPPGSTSASFGVPVRGDPFLEPDETFLVNLTVTPGVILAAGQARGTIRNDDVASADNPVPALHAIDPVSAMPGGDGFELRVLGANLLPTSVVRWNGSGRTTTFVSARELRAAIPAADLLAAGVARVSVFSPSPGGGRSEAVPFVVSLPSTAISFARADVPAGDGPTFVAADDLNGDGRADLVVAHSEADTISVWLGNGDGTFAPPVGYASGDGPSWLALADLDMDGDLDLAVANPSSGTVSVFRGDGAGGFAPRSDYDCGAQPSSVVAADFNADGKLDLAVGRVGGGGVSVLLGNGDGTFLSPGYVSEASAYGITMLAAGEFTGEGRLDLLASYQDGMRLLVGNGEGVFAAAPQVMGGCCTDWRIAPADFNRDGALDFVFVNYNGGENGVTVHFGNNAGGFPWGVGGPGMPSPYFPVVADFNADGVLDSVWTNRNHSSVSLLLGSGYYGFQSPTTFPAGGSPRGAAAADFDGDGRLDVAIANFDSDTLSILTNTPAPALSVSNTGTNEGNALTIDTVFTVTLSPPSVAAVTVSYATADGSATAGSDYVAKSGSLTFLPGETTKSVAITVFGDLAYEPDETFFLNLSGAVGAEVADGQGRATIVNDDTGFELSVSDVSVGEGDAGPAEAVFTVSMPIAVPAGETVTVGYSTADGTAQAGFDYQAVAGILTFAEGESSKTVSVPLLPDALDEIDEAFFLDLAGPVGALIVDGRGQATAVDDDPEPALSIGDVVVTEGASVTTARFTVTLSAPSGKEVRVSAATADGTALAGTDYLPTSCLLVFTLGMTTRECLVTVTGDAVPEADETFFVSLSVPVNAGIGDGQGQGTIRDDDTLARAEVTSPPPGSGLAQAAVTFTWSPGVGAARYWLSVGTTPGGTQLYHEDQGQALSREVTGLPTDGRPIHVRLWTLLGTEWQFGDYGYNTGSMAKGFYTVTPCRLVDTRTTDGPLGGPALVANQDRTFTLAGECSVPLGATSLSLNLTVTQATAAGNLALFPGGTPPSASAINYVAGLTRANNGIFRLGPAGELVVLCRQAAGTAHLVLDVNGYFVE